MKTVKLSSFSCQTCIAAIKLFNMVKLFKIKSLFIVSLFLWASLYSTRAHSIDPRTKAVLTMAAYGTAGGALLGTASLAFGTKGRAVAIGASLGLYAGIIFGSYIVLEHRLQNYQRQHPQEYYPDSDFSPYESGDGGGWGDWFGGGAAFRHQQQLSYALDSSLSARDEFSLRSHTRVQSWGGVSADYSPPVFVNLFQYQF